MMLRVTESPSPEPEPEVIHEGRTFGTNYGRWSATDVKVSVTFDRRDPPPNGNISYIFI